MGHNKQCSRTTRILLPVPRSKEQLSKTQPIDNICWSIFGQQERNVNFTVFDLVMFMQIFSVVETPGLVWGRTHFCKADQPYPPAGLASTSLFCGLCSHWRSGYHSYALQVLSLRATIFPFNKN